MSEKGKSSVSTELFETPYDILRQYQETGNEGLLTEELRIYIDQLNLVRQAYDKYKSQGEIVRALKLAYPGLAENMYSALYDDALNFFYCDNRVKKETWKNIYAKKLDDLTLLAIHRDDLKSARELIKLAAEIRGLFLPDKPEIPEEMYQKRIEIISADESLIGGRKFTKVELIRRLEKYGLDDVGKARAIRDAGFSNDAIFDDDAEN